LPAAFNAGLIGRVLMPAKDDPVVIKKYANRRLYNTGTSTYVTLEDLAEMVKRGEDFTVQDAKTGDDITHPVLTQIIFELENKDGQNMLPIPFLRQLISFYGDQMQMVVPSFLEQSMIAFAKEQERFREQMKSALGKTPMDMMKITTPIKALEEQTRRNIEMFQNAMRMFTPFPPGSGAAPSPAAEPAKKEASEKSDDLQELKEQIAAMQRKIESMG
jgi:polyhydroxyalkanoate synthesis repressor PhaR